MIQLFDRLIDLYCYKTGATKDEDAFTIFTPRYGIKPQITISWHRVPGNFCYNCQLRITNMFLNWNIYDIEAVKIVAGYSSNCGTKTITLYGQVFDAYRASPGPDGVSVLDCITASADASLFTHRPYDFLYYNSKYTVKEVLERCRTEIAQAKDTALVFETALLSSDLLNISWNDKSYEEERFTTGYGLLDYLQRHLSQLASARNKHKVFMTVFGSQVIFEEADEQGNPCVPPEDTKSIFSGISIPILDAVSELTFTAGTLTGKAPWNPDIYPGCVFYCSPAFYTGGTGLPNQLARQGTNRDRLNLYYCISQAVTFSTSEALNEMQLLAVQFASSPAKNLAELDTNSTDIEGAEAKLLDAAAQQLVKDAKAQVLEAGVIKFGDRGVVQNSPLNKAAASSSEFAGNKLGNKTFSLLSDFLADWAKSREIKDFTGYPSGRDLVKIPGMYFCYPFVSFATAVANKDSINKYNPNMPNLITSNTTIVIPTNALNYASYQGDEDMIKWFREFAKQMKISAPQWSANLLKIADILESGEVVDE